jgi:hypothetical protein
MQAAWLFNWSGMIWETQYWAREIMDLFYGTTPEDGYQGDGDEGQMSAWFVMSALGLFQMDGGTSQEPIYEIGSPLFEKAVIHLDNKYYQGNTFTIEARNNSKENRYIQSAVLNEKPLNKKNTSIIILLFALFTNCKRSAKTVSNIGEEKIIVAVYHFPNYHADDPCNVKQKGEGWSEWELVKTAQPRLQTDRFQQDPIRLQFNSNLRHSNSDRARFGTESVLALCDPTLIELYRVSSQSLYLKVCMSQLNK